MQVAEEEPEAVAEVEVVVTPPVTAPTISEVGYCPDKVVETAEHNAALPLPAVWKAVARSHAAEDQDVNTKAKRRHYLLLLTRNGIVSS